MSGHRFKVTFLDVDGDDEKTLYVDRVPQRMEHVTFSGISTSFKVVDVYIDYEEFNSDTPLDAYRVFIEKVK